MIYLHKILPFFLSPLGVSLILLIVFCFNRQKFFIFLSLSILLTSTNTFVGNYLFAKLEYPYKPVSYNSIKYADAVVVLSGGISHIKERNVSRYQWGLPNRFFAGVSLIKKGKADKLIFTAGQLPWDDGSSPEGVILKKKALELGVDKKKILVSTKVENTYQESVALLKLIPNNSSIILVTSAFHMKRSKYLFEKQGFNTTPFPVDFKTSKSKFTVLDFIPNVHALQKTSQFIRENIGRLYYKIIF